MKEYKLAAWPDLPPAFQRTVYRRMVCDMSHRYVSFAQLAGRSGLSRIEVRSFLDVLGERGLLRERDAEPDSIFGALRPLGGWLRRTIGDTSRN